MKNPLNKFSQSISKSLSVVILMSSALVSCSNDSNGGAPVGPGVVGVSVAPVTLKAQNHRPEQCPRAIQGSWTTRNKNRSLSRSTFAYQGEQLVRTDTESVLVYDGTVRELAPNQDMLQGGARLWYVGACRKQKLIVKLHAAGPRGVIEKREETIVRRNRLETRALIESGGYTMPDEYFATRSF